MTKIKNTIFESKQKKNNKKISLNKFLSKNNRESSSRLQTGLASHTKYHDSKEKIINRQRESHKLIDISTSNQIKDMPRYSACICWFLNKTYLYNRLKGFQSLYRTKKFSFVA